MAIAGAIAFVIISSILGLMVGHHASLPLGPTIIMIAGLLFICSVLFGLLNGLIQRFRLPSHLDG